ncbi:class I SAM-dependent methyltransferase [Erythrobacter dokdonensis]|uniref:Methyltransferase type 11 n=1 Tax=Erythrobacter dokdonensis DSW-74 TaxID=1300349 RepID=A0A1A7BF78_9SPHN|nr:class I SAM-dependent methyltransferase [Erythrobacter dokdonensis]OBV11144.1 Methyltransferase type 11 [Erythrobacter dokdonensis DSW-74]
MHDSVSGGNASAKFASVRESAARSRIAAARNRALDRNAGIEKFANRMFSGTTYALWRRGELMTLAVSGGLTLDAGSGRGGWASIITRRGRRESVDIAPRGDEQVTWTADLQHMPQVPTDRYDGVVCHQVLEHLPDPTAAVAEIHRVLKPGGMAVISVPHLSRQHELPHDFQRYTPAGLQHLVESEGLELLELAHYGGLACFVHHQLATLGCALFSILPIIGTRLFAAINAPFSVLAHFFDAWTDRSGLLANGVIAIVRKPCDRAAGTKPDAEGDTTMGTASR